MKKMSNSCTIVLLAVVAAFTFATCAARAGSSTVRKTQSMETDSVMRQSVGDSIYILLMKAKEIRAVSFNTESNPPEKGLRLNRVQREILRFILTDVKNYQSNATVYGKFASMFQLTFRYKGNSCILNFDFGLNKWQLCEKTGRVLKQYDLKINNMLRFAHLIFPEDNLINELINTDKK